MSRTATESIARELESLFDGSSVAGLSDRQLLDRFTAARDPAGEAAFAALVARHGPMVLNICRQLLGDHHHAEDSFQAVFLVLARRARSIRDPDLLGNWLYGVALRTARCAKLQLDRRRKKEEGDAMNLPRSGSSAAAEPIVNPADQPILDREQAEAIHREIDRLPKSFRLPIVLCYFEGLTLDEAARRMRCPAGTLRSRLARSRDKLRRALTRRGIVLPAAAISVFLDSRAANASVSTTLCNVTARAAIKFADERIVSSAATALAREVLRSVFVSQMRLVTLSVIVLVSGLIGSGFLARALEYSNENRMAPAAQQPPIAAKSDDANPKPAPGRMFVVGRVLDPDGKPVKGASVDLLTMPRKFRVGASATDAYYANYTMLGQGKTDGDGRYRLQTPRTSWTEYRDLIAVGSAPGFGLGWADLNPDAGTPGAEFRLRPEHVIHLKLLDVNGMPAAGVEVRVRYLGRIDDRGEFKGVRLLEGPPTEIRAWPRPVKTDHQGKLVLSGIGSGLSVNLIVNDDRYAQQYLHLQTDGLGGSQEISLALQPAQIIEGRVLAADTLLPIPSAAISATTGVRAEIFTAKFHADAHGRFRLNPIVGDECAISAFPSSGEPYLIPEEKLTWVKGAVKVNHDIKLPRGVLMHGRVTDHATGRPLAGSSIQFIPLQRNNTVLSAWQAIVSSREDGCFDIAVPPGKGHLLVFGPTPEYVLEEIGANRLHNDKPGGVRYRCHAIIAYEVRAGDQPPPVNASLRPGVTLKGRVEGPDGQTVTESFFFTTLRIDPLSPQWWLGIRKNPVRDGRFELHGIAPEATTRVNILDPDHEWGASVDLSAEQAGEDVTIRLQPCGQARARFVGPDSKPLVKHRPHIEFVATPGPSQFSRSKRDELELKADEVSLGNIDRKHYWNGPLTDAEGLATLPDLIPGALYRILDFSTNNVRDKGSQIRKDFTVKPRETIDLGDILIEKPQK